MERFLKSSENKVFTGILGGLAKCFGISARLLRICFFILAWNFRFFVYIYIILMFAMPEENEQYEETGTFISNLKLPVPVKKVLSRFWSSCTEICSVLFRD